MYSNSFKNVTRAISKDFVSNFFSSNLRRAALGCVAHKFKVIPLHLRMIKRRMIHNYREKIIQVQKGNKGNGELMFAWITSFVSLRFTIRRNHFMYLML